MSFLFVSNSAIRPSDDDARQTVVGRHRRKSAVRTDVGFEPAMHRKTAPVGVVRSEQRWPLIVSFGADDLGHDGVAAIRTDDDGGTLGDRVALFEWPLMPTTRPSSVTNSSTLKPSRTSAPASAAASTSSLSRMVRRGQ